MVETAAPKMAEEELLRMTAEVVAAYVSNNTLADWLSWLRSSTPYTPRCSGLEGQVDRTARRNREAGGADPQVGHARTTWSASRTARS